ncbi:MAG: ribonuclease HII [Rickettsiales bacterium]|jgi:ribonuclease HII|nr:ribonuclease HII [Rickettsiales bacterium]
MIAPDFSFEIESGCRLVAGVDEAGRGPLCGPVVAAAVVFKEEFIELADSSCKDHPRPCGGGRDEVAGGGFVYSDKPTPRQLTLATPAARAGVLPLINDSKKMSATARGVAYDWIMKNCLVGVGQCSPAEIDEINILQASMLAMKRAIAALPVRPDFILVDGNRLPDNVKDEGRRTKAEGVAAPPSSFYGKAIVKGDGKSLSIAAASIIAKETRDRIMDDLSREFPQYGWDKNAGYPTSAHLQAMKEFGINHHYRKTYKPVKDLICKSEQ